MSYDLHPVGRVESSLRDLDVAPRQADEGAPEAWLVFESEVAPALSDVAPGMEMFLFTWLDRARRDVLTVHPRGDASRPVEGVFSTRSPHRPNPIGLHLVKIVERKGNRLRVRQLEAVDGTPILDLKPVLSLNLAAR